jgi:putative transposase
MTRPLRLEYAGALYHVTARGNRREAIYLEDADRKYFLELLGEICQRYNWMVHAYCLMTNHYHVLVETPDANLSKGMRQLNGVYTQKFNRNHHCVGHVFQGRYKAILVQKNAHLLELSRYVVLNPVRAGMVKDAGSYRWSSYRETVGDKRVIPWLDADWLLTQFAVARGEAVLRYAEFVQDGVKGNSPWKQLQHQIFLGDEKFVAAFHDEQALEKLNELTKAQKRPLAGPLVEFKEQYGDKEAMVRAYLTGAYTMKEIGDYFGVHYMTVSRAVKAMERGCGNEM